jgi:hypothetical protein
MIEQQLFNILVTGDANMNGLLQWLPDWSPQEWTLCLSVALVANVALDTYAARKLYWGYAAATHIDKVRRATDGKLTKLQWLLLADSGLLTAFLDIYCQISFTKYFWDVPRETTLSKRLTRYLNGPDGRNKRIAETLRDELHIDNFDWRGKHL